MSYILCDAPQGTDAWRAARAGKFTGSEAGDFSRGHAIRLAIERVSGAPIESRAKGADIERGIEQEPFARMAYEAEAGVIVIEAGFAYLPTIQAGCSVDGFVGELGIVEIKCPRPEKHIEYVLSDHLPPEHQPQMLHNLWVTGREWCDFVSYCPDVPGKLRLHVRRWVPALSEIRAHEASVIKFLSLVSVIERQLKERME